MKTRKKGLWLLLALALAGCAREKGIVDRGDYRIDTNHPARNAYSRVRMLVIHYTAASFERSMSLLVGPEVSVHYLLSQQPPVSGGKPLVWALVGEEKLAWHAGISYWRGYRGVNSVSVGIELENPGYREVNGVKVFYPFSDAQIQTLTRLARDIIRRNGIEPQNVVGHADVAPQRKDDPGPLFPWQALAQAGIGAWPDPARVAFYLNGRNPRQPVDTATLLALLARYGYDVKPDLTVQEQQRVIAAFQMHFRPENYDGQADAQTQAIAQALLEKYG
ncbi:MULTISPECIES: N-acetylmuramoyl-L-alanine amidase [Tenebrionibacter/Tenebrionicola group]|jgi:N-acetylmuramoyl-L-alanine amidase|uniref:N-acetylmuramoyl-L-alanine amidase n=2 Tax=Tenebrionibacter/Tenebrionicola group TaxID=2969848 RepID=A0A8K0V048_9ENTR|nr:MULTISPECIES: N-acetylmuramoyl-L-alanine amidase [Tenebrionibacter/Tenebrionicola group]MBK4714789.1 N-acetylmuramoyl-L-alanine amidase [Tenebrionibacter intestinalis]MBV5095534.1 N-acetylmuramoyl-L-alanine amidase [Tenebrionicola larvae]